MTNACLAGDFAHAEGSSFDMGSGGWTAWAKADLARCINRSFEAAFAHPAGQVIGRTIYQPHEIAPSALKCRPSGGLGDDYMGHIS